MAINIRKRKIKILNFFRKINLQKKIMTLFNYLVDGDIIEWKYDLEPDEIDGIEDCLEEKEKDVIKITVTNLSVYPGITDSNIILDALDKIAYYIHKHRICALGGLMFLVAEEKDDGRIVYKPEGIRLSLKGGECKKSKGKVKACRKINRNLK